MQASHLPVAAAQVRNLVTRMETAAAAALGINVTTLRGREPLKRQISNLRPRRQETYPSLPVRPYLLQKGSPAAPWRSGAPGKALDSWCEGWNISNKSGAPLRPMTLVEQHQSNARVNEWQPPPPSVLPHVLFGDQVMGDVRTAAERVGYKEQHQQYLRAVEQHGERQRSRSVACAGRARQRSDCTVVGEKYTLPERLRDCPYSGTDPNIKFRPILSKTSKEQGHGLEFLYRHERSNTHKTKRPTPN